MKDLKRLQFVEGIGLIFLGVILIFALAAFVLVVLSPAGFATSTADFQVKLPPPGNLILEGSGKELGRVTPGGEILIEGTEAELKKAAADKNYGTEYPAFARLLLEIRRERTRRCK